MTDQRYHYEYLPERGQEHAYRVANEEDDLITSFSTEQAAATFVVEHNKKVFADVPATWRYGYGLHPPMAAEAWDFEELATAAKKAMDAGFIITGYDSRTDIPWPRKFDFDHANCLGPVQALKGKNISRIDEDQCGRDPLTQVLSVILQVGIEQGRRITLNGSVVQSMQIELRTAKLLAK